MIDACITTLKYYRHIVLQFRWQTCSKTRGMRGMVRSCCLKLLSSCWDFPRESLNLSRHVTANRVTETSIWQQIESLSQIKVPSHPRGSHTEVPRTHPTVDQPKEWWILEFPVSVVTAPTGWGWCLWFGGLGYVRYVAGWEYRLSLFTLRQILYVPFLRPSGGKEKMGRGAGQGCPIRFLFPLAFVCH